MNFIKNFDHFLFDLDGVVYVGDKPTDGADEVVRTIRENGKTVNFITNNPTRKPSEYSKKLGKMGIEAREDEIITSPMAVARYLREKHKNLVNRKAYISGSEYLIELVAATGVNIVPDVSEDSVDFVILGGHNGFNYGEIRDASFYIRNGAEFIATNRDPFYPSDSGFLPATGALLASVETASGVTAVTVGKPEKYIFDIVRERYGSRKTVMIGDNLHTDILGGKNSGYKTVLTLTGAASEKDINESSIFPDFVIKNLKELTEVQ